MLTTEQKIIEVVYSTFKQVAQEVDAMPEGGVSEAATKVAPYQLCGVIHSMQQWSTQPMVAACILARAREYAFEIPNFMSPYVRRRLKISNITAMRVSKELNQVIDDVVVVQGAAPALFTINKITTQWTVDLLVFYDPLYVFMVREEDTLPIQLPRDTVLKFMSNEYLPREARITPISNSDMPDRLITLSENAKGGILCDDCSLRRYCSLAQ